MDNSIKFYDFQMLPGKVDFKAHRVLNNTEQIDDLYFRFNKAFIPRNDLIAIALSTLCGETYPNVHIDLVITIGAADKIRDFTGAELTCAGIEEVSPGEKEEPVRDSVALSFSGGFDSLAASCVLPDDTKLVSIDFGHWFQRETDFFEKFDTNILSTNVRKYRYDAESWTFMGLGAILYSDYLNIKYHAFGTVLEAGTNEFIFERYDMPLTPISQAGMIDITAVSRGLTVAGTAMLISHYRPELMKDSLYSLGQPGSEKLFRKKVVMDIVCERYQRDIAWDDTINDTHIDHKYRFGEYLGSDIPVLYILKYRGIEVASRAIAGIPEEAVRLVDSLTLDWYEKLPPAVPDAVPEEFQEQYLAKLGDAGIELYSDDDYKECQIVREFLSRYNAELRERMAKNGMINSSPRISVIMPVNNAAWYLREWLDSVAGQTFTDIEIICINNGSSDSSYMMLKGYAETDPRIRIFNHDDNDVTAAIFSGIRTSRGEYILALNDDTFWDCHTLGLLYDKAFREELDVLPFPGRIPGSLQDEEASNPEVWDYFQCLYMFKRELFDSLKPKSFEELFGSLSHHPLCDSREAFNDSMLSHMIDRKDAKVKIPDRTIEGLNVKIAGLEDRIEQLNSRLERRDADVNELNDWIRKLIADRERLGGEVKRLKGERKELKAKIAAKEADLRAIRGKLKKIQASFSYRLGRVLTAPIRIIKRAVKPKK